jgi:hypothetical protein
VMANPAVAEAIRQMAGWTVSLWLAAEPVHGHSGGHGSGKARMQPGTSGPMCGIVHLDDTDDGCFAFHRPGRAVVRLRYDQVVMWNAMQPPAPPPLPVEETPR